MANGGSLMPIPSKMLAIKKQFVPLTLLCKNFDI
jgi:hypothetical protein